MIHMIFLHWFSWEYILFAAQLVGQISVHLHGDSGGCWSAAGCALPDDVCVCPFGRLAYRANPPGTVLLDNISDRVLISAAPRAQFDPAVLLC